MAARLSATIKATRGAISPLAKKTILNITPRAAERIKELISQRPDAVSYLLLLSLYSLCRAL